MNAETAVKLLNKKGYSIEKVKPNVAYVELLSNEIVQYTEEEIIRLAEQYQ